MASAGGIGVMLNVSVAALCPVARTSSGIKAACRGNENGGQQTGKIITIRLSPSTAAIFSGRMAIDVS